MSMNVVEASGLGKRYGTNWALRSARWRSPPGRGRARRAERRRQDHALNLAVGLAAPTAGS